MTPERRTMIATLALAVHKGNEQTSYLSVRGTTPRATAQQIGRDSRESTGTLIEYTIADPPEYPVLVFRDPPDTRDVPLEKYPPEPDPFDRDEYWWRRK